ncbi:uncharacterized protein LOC133469997 isoform X1 [Phyllopteryx taeniolatus]|uniref:uncharacterized protein LOC133469997 isoform X1 n=1 Tax=Phyllopteryx taeniolatus TaxID=161469 RepID=UPI002AD38316|nr:uncharacterized protein LOC133469997 isoform X1 [Phyllopteryx taeniolatus]
MPASKRGTEEPLDPQAKSRRLDDDSEALRIETTPATNIRSLKEIHMQEQIDTAAPRTKRKLSEEEEEVGGNPAKSCRQSSPLRCTLGPSVTKHTSAICPEARSDGVNAESDDDNMTGDSSNHGLFTESDNSSCIKKYSNRVRTKPGCDLLKVSEELAPSTTDFLQNEHSYGRASDSSLDSTANSAENTTKENLSIECTAAGVKFAAENMDRKITEGRCLTANNAIGSSVMDSNSEAAATIKGQSVGTFCSRNGDVNLEKLIHGTNCQTDCSSEYKETVSSVIKQDLTQNTEQRRHEMKADSVLMSLYDICGEDQMPPTATAEEIVVESCNPETSSEENQAPETKSDQNRESQFEELLTSASENQTEENLTVTDTGSNWNSKIEITNQFNRNSASKIEDNLTIALERNPERHIQENQGSHIKENVIPAEPDRKPACQIELESNRTSECPAESVLVGIHNAECAGQEIQMDPTNETEEAMESSVNPASQMETNLTATESDKYPDSLAEDLLILKETVPTSEEVLVESYNAQGQIKSRQSPENATDENMTKIGQTQTTSIDDLSTSKKTVPASQEVLIGSLNAQIEKPQIENAVQETVTVECYSQPETEENVAENLSLSTESTPQGVLVNHFTAQSQIEEVGESLRGQTEEVNPISVESDRNPVTPDEENVLASPSLSQETENHSLQEVLADCFNGESQVKEHQMVSDGDPENQNEENLTAVEDGKNFESHVEDLSLSEESEPTSPEVLVDSFNEEEYQIESNKAENGTAMDSDKNLACHLDLLRMQDTEPMAQESLLGSRNSEGELESDQHTECQLEENLTSMESVDPSPSKGTEPIPQEVLVGCLSAGSQVEENPVELDKNPQSQVEANLLIMNSSRKTEQNVTKQTEATPQEVLRDFFNAKGLVEEKHMKSKSHIHENFSEQKLEQALGSLDSLKTTTEVLTPDCEAADNQNSTMEMAHECVTVSQHQTDVEMPSEGRFATATLQEEIDIHPTQNVDDVSNTDMMSGNFSILEKENRHVEDSTAVMNKVRITASATSENVEHPPYSLEIDPHNNNEPSSHREINLGITESAENEDKVKLEYITEDSISSNSEKVQDVKFQDSPKVSNHVTDVSAVIQKDLAPTNIKSSGTEEHIAVLEKKEKTHEGEEMELSQNSHNVCEYENNMNVVPVATSVSPADLQMQRNNDLVNLLGETKTQISQAEVDMHPTADMSSEALIEENQEEATFPDAHDSQAEISMEHEDSVAQENVTTSASEISYETQNLEGQMWETSHLEIHHETELPPEVCEDAMTDHSSNEDDAINLNHAHLLQNPQTTSAPGDSDLAGSDEKQEVEELAAGICDVQTAPDFTANGCHENMGTAQCLTQVEMDFRTIVEGEEMRKEASESTLVVSILENEDVTEVVARSSEDAVNQAEMDMPSAPESVSKISASSKEIQLQNEDNLCVIAEVHLNNTFVETGATSNAVTTLVRQVEEVAKVTGTLALVDSGNTSLDHMDLLSESVYSTLEMETSWQDEDATAKMFSNRDTVGEDSECDVVQIVVLAQPAVTATVPQSSEEQNEAASQSQIENQIVYEPISSPESSEDADAAIALENQGLMSLKDIPSILDTKEALSTNECMQASLLQLENVETAKEEQAGCQAVVEMMKLQTTTTFPETDADGKPVTPVEKQYLWSSQYIPSTQDMMEDLTTNESMEANRLKLGNKKTTKEQLTDDQTAVEMEEVRQTTTVSESNGDDTTDLETQALVSLEEVTSTQDTKENLLAHERAENSHLQLENDESAKKEQTAGQVAVEMEVEQTVPECSPRGNRDGDAAVALVKQYLASSEAVSKTQNIKEDLCTNESKDASHLHLKSNETVKQNSTGDQTAVEMEELQQTTTVPERNGDATTNLEKKDLVSFKNVPSTQETKEDWPTNESAEASHLQLENDESTKEEQTAGQAAVEMEVQQTTAAPESSPESNRDGDAIVALEKKDLVSFEDVPSTQETKEDLSTIKTMEANHLHLDFNKTAKQELKDDQAAVEMEELKQTTKVPESNEDRDAATHLGKQDLVSLEKVQSTQGTKEDRPTNASAEASHLQLENNESAKEEQKDGQAVVEMEVQQTTTVPESNREGDAVVALEKKDLVSFEDVPSTQETKKTCLLLKPWKLIICIWSITKLLNKN